MKKKEAGMTPDEILISREAAFLVKKRTKPAKMKKVVAPNDTGEAFPEPTSQEVDAVLHRLDDITVERGLREVSRDAIVFATEIWAHYELPVKRYGDLVENLGRFCFKRKLIITAVEALGRDPANSYAGCPIRGSLRITLLASLMGATEAERLRDELLSGVDMDDPSFKALPYTWKKTCAGEECTELLRALAARAIVDVRRKGTGYHPIDVNGRRCDT
jgi:hypothetical protein